LEGEDKAAINKELALVSEPELVVKAEINSWRIVGTN
jgi:hypothetical protein